MENFNPNDYFKQLAIEHIDIQHTEDKPAYFREYSTVRILFNNSDFLDKMKYMKRTGLVSQFNNDGGTSGGHDSKNRIFTGAIYVITRIINKSKDEAQAHCKQIMNDIFARMQHDMEGMTIPITTELNNIKYHSLDEIADGFYGLAGLISYQESAECIVYDSSKWQSST